MKKVFTLITALFVLSFASFSQEDTRQIKEPEKTVFKPHAFMQLQGGAAYTLGEAKFKDLISPAASLQIGYRFSPVFGMRFGGTGWIGKGGWAAPAQLYEFNYVEGSVDFMIDLASAFGGFNPSRVVSPYIFLGGGGAYGFNNDEAKGLNTGGYKLELLWEDSKAFWAVRGGLGFDFRLSDNVSLLLEGNVNMLPDDFNSKDADHPDWQFNALAGIKINLGKSVERIPPVYYEPQPEPAPAPKPAPRPAPAPAPKPVVKEMPELPYIYFAFDSDVVDTQKYASELATIVSVLKEFSNENVDVVGYTDHHGPDVYNDGLSLRRAEAVKKYLVEQGISASRLKTSGEGKDPKTEGRDRLTIKARRVEVTK
ncbi:MAG: OmpA family protein [Fermentimonas sp.]|jgi:OOP family OmpA-OmpF porin